MAQDPPSIQPDSPRRRKLEEQVDNLRANLFRLQRDLEGGDLHANFNAELLVYQVMMRTISDESLRDLAANLRHWIENEGDRRLFECSYGEYTD